MKEAVQNSPLQIAVRDVGIPKPAPGQILIRVVVSGTNPKDWKLPHFKIWGNDENDPKNHGDDIAGYIEAIGEGNRPASKLYALPEAATIPLTAMTAAIGLYQRLSLPLPWKPARAAMPLVVYGGSTAVGAFTIKLARLSNIHPIIAVAGNGIPFVETLIDRAKGDIIIDYRGEGGTLSDRIRNAVGLQPILHAYDAVGDKRSLQEIASVMAKGGTINTVQPVDKPETIPGWVDTVVTMVGTVHPGSRLADPAHDDAEFGYVLFRFFGRGLQKGRFTGHPFKVINGGLNGLETALKALKAGKASAVKYVVKIEETDGVGI
ncbi:hypothetical protein MHUMG1_05747 [Metarhizium humberi]|uniref:Alcohol dehydrogenase superfamily, zinc-type n=1 Tax=Metarhizium humberi TaxID=2596975 RepID=A0A9P8S7S7_9HYPO|nr:hypothetical protein MHUMG1_05747 [Metarhizium humberi]